MTAQLMIETLTEQESQRVAMKFIHAEDMVYDAAGEYLSNHPNDLKLVQDFINVAEPEDFSSILWESLGIVVGMVFTAEHLEYDWCINTDEKQSRRVCVCNGERILFYPEQLFDISRKQSIDVLYYYEGIVLQAKI